MKILIFPFIFLMAFMPSIAQSYDRDQNIVAGEYFFDEDPGEGNGESIDTRYGFAFAEATLEFPDIEEGTIIYIRFRSTNGRWSPARAVKYQIPFQNRGAELVYGEYFINDDPGVGRGTEFDLRPDGGINIPSIELSKGDIVHFRVRDSFGRWSSVNGRQFNYKTISAAVFYAKLLDGSITPIDTIETQPHNDPASAFYEAIGRLQPEGTIDSIFVSFYTEDYITSGWRSVDIPNGPPVPTLSFPPDNAIDQSTTPTLTWDQAQGAASYYVQVATDSNFTQLMVNDSSLTRAYHQIGPLAINTKYYWHVRAKNNDGISPWSETWNFTTIDIVPPSAPLLVSPANNSSDQLITLSLTWRSSERAESYSFQLARDYDFTDITDDSSGIIDTTIQIGPLEFTTDYFWRVQASNDGGISPWSSIWKFTTVREAVAFVYPGDANNDGIVDVRDILPIGRYYNQIGQSRPNASLNWEPQPLFEAWDTESACYADCNGNGRVEQDDVQVLVRNWFATPEEGVPENIDRREVCFELLRSLESSPKGSVSSEIREGLIQYLYDEFGIVLEYSLEQNYPNPFNSMTKIQFTLPESASLMRISIYNVNGQLIWDRELINVSVGMHHVIWHGTNNFGINAASGLYFCVINANNYTNVRKMLLFR